MSYQGLGEESYTAFKQRFYARVGDGSLFDCDGINLLKVVLDGLKVNYVARGRYRNMLLQSSLMDSIYRRMKRQPNLLAKPEPGKVLIGLSARSINDPYGKPVPVFFERIFRELGRDSFYYVTEGGNDAATKLGADTSVAALTAAFGYLPLSEAMKHRRKALRDWFAALKQKNIFDAGELENIGYALDKFFREGCTWRHFIDWAKPRRVVMSSHYHHEGLIDAARAHGIEIVEVQHGLIAPEDIFHIFPQQVKPVMAKALLPDRMLVFGEFWADRKKSGAEAACMRFETGGYFLYENTDPGPEREAVLEFIAQRKLLLITSQYSMDEHFRDFALKLAKKISPDWCIILKPHPHESSDLFAALNAYANVLVTRANLDFLLSMTKIQVSVFSTTLFDGLRYGVLNYALDLPQFSDYVNSMVEAGIAHRLDPEADPTRTYDASTAGEKISNAQRYYQSFNRDAFEDLLK